MQVSSWNSTAPLSSPRYAALQKEPKAEIHIHVGGAFPPAYLRTIASEDQRRELDVFLERIKQRIDYEDVFAVFPLISRIVDTNKKIEDGAFHICEELKSDGVRVVELRSTLKTLDGKDEETYLKALLEGINRSTTEDFTASILLSIKRDSSAEFVKTTVDLALKYKSQGVVGIDISGVSTTGDIGMHLPILKEAKDQGLFISAHIGESYDETDQMDILQQLEPHRIGHGVCLAADAIEWIKEHKIPVEVCLTSAKLVKMHEMDSLHPWLLAHKEEGHPIVLCTDDPTVFGVSLTDEYYGLLKEALINGSHPIFECFHPINQKTVRTLLSRVCDLTVF